MRNLEDYQKMGMKDIATLSEADLEDYESLVKGEIVRLQFQRSSCLQTFHTFALTLKKGTILSGHFQRRAYDLKQEYSRMGTTIRELNMKFVEFKRAWQRVKGTSQVMTWVKTRSGPIPALI
jgi:hypothetical protein